ncbi:MAG: DMT family transporter [Bdellovibrionales bacterium]|jgi:drug/metabolite transporter (DMT)-like permease|nr:DMT family transporter [Bdellovibrionales bacterium]
MTAPALPDIQRQGLGIGFMLGSALCLSVMNVVVKWLTLAEYSILQIVFINAICGFFSVGGWMVFSGRLHWARRVRPLLLVYLVAALTSCLTLFYAFGHGQLAQISTVVAASPLLVAGLSFVFLGERLSRGQVSLILLGFAGILLVLRPGGDMGEAGAVFPVVVALCGTAALAVSQVLVRKMSRSVHTAAVMLYFYLAASVVTGALVFGGGQWQAVDMADIPLFLGCAAADVFAMFLMYSAFRCAPASMVMPFQYTNIVWSALMGYVIWQETPDIWTWAGAMVIIGTGILFTRTALLRKSVMAAQT